MVLAAVLKERDPDIGLRGPIQQIGERDAGQQRDAITYAEPGDDRLEELTVAELGITQERQPNSIQRSDRFDQHLAAAIRRGRALMQDERHVWGDAQRLPEPTCTGSLECAHVAHHRRRGR